MIHFCFRISRHCIILALGLFVGLWSACSNPANPIINKPSMKYKVIQTQDAPKPIGPYSQAREFQGLVYLSGQIALDPQTQVMVQDNIESETHRVMQNIKAILKEAGLSMEDIIKTTIFLADMSDFQKVNEVYAWYFREFFPARETIEVKALPKGARVEISCIAARPPM